MRYLLIFLFIFLQASSITQTKKALTYTKYTIKKTNLKLDALAKDIINTEEKLNNINKKISSLNEQIQILQNSLKNSSKTLNELNDLNKGLFQKQKNINNEITSFVSQNYYIDSKKINTLNDLIYTSLSFEILKNYSKKINDLIQENKNIQNNINKINKQINEISEKEKELEQKKQQLIELKKAQLKILATLKKQKNLYKTKLQNMVKKQEFLQKKLTELKIIKSPKTSEISNAEISKPISVKKVGSAYIKPKIIHYHGPKTIPPVKGTVIKEFGSYIDPIYKIRIYNDSITIKTQPNALVKTILPGKVIYIGNEGDKKIIFIKHENNLFSIYANLSKISPLIKKGSYVKKGEVIARVNNSLEFEVTYKDRAIDPLQVIKLK